MIYWTDAALSEAYEQWYQVGNGLLNYENLSILQMKDFIIAFSKLDNVFRERKGVLKATMCIN